MTFDPKKPVTTNEGQKARILCADKKQTGWPIVALIEMEDGCEFLVHCTKDGKTHDPSTFLVNIPEKMAIDQWINVYPNMYIALYDTRGAADGCASNKRIACLHIVREFVVGEGL